jgi:hypothetical protein
MSNKNEVIVDKATDYTDLDSTSVAIKFVKYLDSQCKPLETNKVTIDFSQHAYYFDYPACSVIFDWFFDRATNESSKIKVDNTLTIKTRLVFRPEDFAYLFTKHSKNMPEFVAANNSSQTPFSERLNLCLTENSINLNIVHSIDPRLRTEKTALKVYNFPMGFN